MCQWLSQTAITLTLCVIFPFCLQSQSCPTISNLSLDTQGCLGDDLKNFSVESTASSVTVRVFPYGFGINPYTSPNGVDIATIPVVNGVAQQASIPSTGISSTLLLVFALPNPISSDPTCQPFADATVQQYNPPNMYVEDTEVCSGERLNFEQHLFGGNIPTSFYASMSDLLVQENEIFPKYLYPTSSGAYYSLSRESNAPLACSTIDTLFVTVLPKPNVVVGPGADICAGDVVQLTSSGGANYEWSPAASLSSATVSNPIASPNKTSTYAVTVTGSNACRETGQVTVNVTQKPICQPIKSQ